MTLSLFPFLCYVLQYKTCNCPANRRPCTKAEAVASLTMWSHEADTVCDRDWAVAVLASDSEFFFCALRSFTKVDTVAHPIDCGSQDYAYVLCEGG